MARIIKRSYSYLIFCGVVAFYGCFTFLHAKDIAVEHTQTFEEWLQSSFPTFFREESERMEKERVALEQILRRDSSFEQVTEQEDQQFFHLPIFRRFVYEQQTKWRKEPTIDRSPVLARSGSHAVFSLQTQPLPIFLMDFESGEVSKIDSFLESKHAKLSISDDASKVVASDGKRVRVSFKGAKEGKEVLALRDEEIETLRISGDGKLIALIIRRDTRRLDNNQEIERGLYTLKPDGTDFQQVVGPGAIARYLGIDEEDTDYIFPFTSYGTMLDLSRDGGKIVFVSQNSAWGNVYQGQRLFVVNSDQTGLTQIRGPLKAFYSVGISGNAAKIAYTCEPFDEPLEGVVVNVDGSRSKRLATLDQLRFVDASSKDEPIQLSYDGVKLSFGTQALLFDTEEENYLRLAQGGGPNNSIFGDRLFGLSMNDEGDRFVFLVRDDRRKLQLATLRLNILEEGEAPSIRNVGLSSKYLIAGAKNAKSIQADVLSKNRLLGVVVEVYRDGEKDKNLQGFRLLRDDDEDGTFSHRFVKALEMAAEGSRTLRIKAEVTDSKNMHHALVVEAGPFEVKRMQ